MLLRRADDHRLGRLGDRVSLIDQVSGLEHELMAERDCSTRAKAGDAIRRVCSRAFAHMNWRHVAAELVAHAAGICAAFGMPREHFTDLCSSAFDAAQRVNVRRSA